MVYLPKHMNRIEQGSFSEGRRAFTEKLSRLLGPDYELHNVFRPPQGGQAGVDKIVWQQNESPSSSRFIPSIELSRPVYGNHALPDYTVAVRTLAARYSQNSSDTPEWYAALYGQHFNVLGLEPIPTYNLDGMNSKTAENHAQTIHPGLVQASESIATIEGLKRLQDLGFVIFSRSGRTALKSQ